MLIDGHVQQHVRFFQFAEILFPGLDDFLQLAELLLDFFCPGLIIPEIMGKGQLLQPFRLQFLAGQVKDAPSGPACGPSDPEAVVSPPRIPLLLPPLFFPRSVPRSENQGYYPLAGRSAHIHPVACRRPAKPPEPGYAGVGRPLAA